MSCNILYLTVSEPCYWCKELLGFVLKDRHDIRSDPLAVRIICPVSFHKAAKDTEKSPSTKTKPLTWILSLCSFHVLFFYHSLSLHISVCLLIRPLISICAHVQCFLFTHCSSSVLWKSFPLCYCYFCRSSWSSWLLLPLVFCHDNSRATHSSHDTRAFLYLVLSAVGETASLRLCCPADEVCPNPCLERRSRTGASTCVCLWTQFCFACESHFELWTFLGSQVILTSPHFTRFTWYSRIRTSD